MDDNQKIKKLEVMLDVHTKEGVAALAKVVGKADLVSRALRDMGKSADAAAGQATKLSRDFVWGVEEMSEKTNSFNMSIKGVDMRMREFGNGTQATIFTVDKFGRETIKAIVPLGDMNKAMEEGTKVADEHNKKILTASEILAKKLHPALTKNNEGLKEMASRYKAAGAMISGAVAGAFKFGIEKANEATDAFEKLQWQFTNLAVGTSSSMEEVGAVIKNTMRKSLIPDANEAGRAFQDLWDVQGFDEASKNLVYMTQMQKIYGVDLKASAETQDEFHALLGGTEEQFRGLQGTAIKAQKAMRLPKNFTKEVMAAIPQMNQLAMQVGGNGTQVKNMTERMMGFAAVMKKSVGASVQSAIKVFGELESKTVGFQSQFERFRLGLTDQLPEQELLQLSKGFKSAGDAYKFMMADQGTKIQMLKKTTAGFNGNAESAKLLYYSLYDTYGPEATNMMIQSATKTDKATAKLFKGLVKGTEKDALGGLADGMEKLGTTLQGKKIRNEVTLMNAQYEFGAKAAGAYGIQLDNINKVYANMENWARTSVLATYLANISGTLKGIAENPIWNLLKSIGIGAMLGKALDWLVKGTPIIQGFAKGLMGILGFIGKIGVAIASGITGPILAIAAALGVLQHLYFKFKEKLDASKTAETTAKNAVELANKQKSKYASMLEGQLGRKASAAEVARVLNYRRTVGKELRGKEMSDVATGKIIVPERATTPMETISGGKPVAETPITATPEYKKVNLGAIKGEAERQMLTQLEQASQFLSSIAGTIQSAVVGEDNKIIIQVDDTQFRNVFRAMMEKDYHLAKA